ncbi:hypothetical protein CCGE525_34165 (plasmid) [Rhizobium jaguaris]|uniref:Uncharacterized protein n=1 Tax=Rhizobium jaguaris TaxID=1312183 RepID=A0A387G008_9HYPH|nr:hypothetical protein CCGE525_34165 [Rhizobium jaguaris]
MGEAHNFFYSDYTLIFALGDSVEKRMNYFFQIWNRDFSVSANEGTCTFAYLFISRLSYVTTADGAVHLLVVLVRLKHTLPSCQ